MVIAGGLSKLVDAFNSQKKTPVLVVTGMKFSTQDQEQRMSDLVGVCALSR